MVTQEEMIEKQLIDRGIRDPRVLRAMAEVDRALFVPEALRYRAYEDGPLPIGESQTISQPYIVAYMAEALQLAETDRVLEIGTGCGYNAAVLGHIAREVYSIEIIEWLAKLAAENLAQTEASNIYLRHGDGYAGWPEAAPFDAIMLTAAPPSVPDRLKYQLKIGGRLLAPVGRQAQNLILVVRTDEDRFTEKQMQPVRFVPMTGKAREK